jgi:hypothetical protein
MILMRANSLQGLLEGMGPFASCHFRDHKSLDFKGSSECHLGPKKSLFLVPTWVPFGSPKCLIFQGPPLPMALVMDMPPSRGERYEVYLLRTAQLPPPRFPQRYKVYLLRTAVPPLIFFFFWGGGFFLFLSYYIQHCFICRPTDSTVLTDAGIEPRTVATGALAVRRSNH